MHLYELSDQMQGLMALIEEGELDQDTLDDTLEGIHGLIGDKAQGILAVMANLGASASAYGAEIKRMQARKKTLDNHQSWLKEYLRSNMARCNITKIESDVFTATLGKPGKSVEIVHPEMVPEFYKETVTEIKIAKAPIAKALKAGDDVPGCRLVDSQAPLTIK